MKPKTLEMETNLTVGEDKNKCQLSTFNEDKMSSQDAGNHNDNALVMDVEERKKEHPCYINQMLGMTMTWHQVRNLKIQPNLSRLIQFHCMHQSLKLTCHSNTLIRMYP